MRAEQRPIYSARLHSAPLAGNGMAHATSAPPNLWAVERTPDGTSTKMFRENHTLLYGFPQRMFSRNALSLQQQKKRAFR